MTSFFILLFIFALYDRLVAQVESYSINLDVLYFVSIYSFIMFWLIDVFFDAYNRMQRLIIVALSLPIAVRILLNLLSIDKDYETYRRLVNNATIDVTTWIVLAFVILVILWQKSIISRR